MSTQPPSKDLGSQLLTFAGTPAGQQIVGQLLPYLPQILALFVKHVETVSQVPAVPGFDGVAPVAPAPAPPAPVDNPDNASPNFTGWTTGGVNNVWHNWYVGKPAEDGGNPDVPESDQANPDYVAAIRSGTKPILPGSSVQFSFDPAPNGARGPAAPVVHVKIGNAEGSAFIDGSDNIQYLGAKTFTLQGGGYRRSRGCYFIVRLAGGEGDLDCWLSDNDGHESEHAKARVAYK